MGEAVPPFHHLDAAAANQIVGRQPVDALALELDRALGDVAAFGLRCRLEIAFSVVDLPAPLAPSRATMPPSGTSSDTPFSTRITWS